MVFILGWMEIDMREKKTEAKGVVELLRFCLVRKRRQDQGPAAKAATAPAGAANF